MVFDDILIRVNVLQKLWVQIERVCVPKTNINHHGVSVADLQISLHVDHKLVLDRSLEDRSIAFADQKCWNV
jgi:hypothetical protein